MNIPASLGDHFAKLKSQLMYREMQENLFIPRQRQVMPNDLFAALMPSHNASAAANQAMQLHMLLQQYFVKSALFNHHQQAALKSIFPPQEKDSLLKSPPIVGKSSAFTPFLKSPERHQLKNSFADPLFVTPYGEKCLKVRDSSNLSPKGASPNSLKSCTLECSKPVFWAPNTKKRKQKAENNFSTKKKKLTDDAAKKSSRKSASCDQSPISGILIRKLNKPKDRATRNKDGTTNTTITSPEMKRGDIDSKYNVVDRSDESKEKLASITNVIGDYTCRLCQDTYLDVYELAEHQCPSIIYIEYKCPECHKAFNCPANLASHRRWHKPRPLTSAAQKLQQNSGTAKVSLEKSNTLVTKQPDIFSPPLDVTA